ncbi:hypothetical protein, partial [Cyanobium sp. BA20m-p-22]|uniref:hypothetical protein n=1 Tax=Cyanobium sp. BA20m-p-22 TaxID=2823704 RepID=UPI0020CDF250
MWHPLASESPGGASTTERPLAERIARLDVAKARVDIERFMPIRNRWSSGRQSTSNSWAAASNWCKEIPANNSWFLQDDLQPSGEFAVIQEEADQASELSGVFWGGVELVLELEKSVS